MHSEEEYRNAIVDRIAEAVEYYKELGARSESLEFAEQRILEIQRLFDQGNDAELRRLVDQFRGVDDCLYGSVFGVTIKVMTEFFEAIDSRD